MGCGSDAKTYLPNSRDCFVCGEDNRAGLSVRFYIEDGAVKTRWRARDHHCGYRNVVHGGVVAAVLDECMGWAAARAVKRLCLTGDLTVRYLKRIPDDRDMIVCAQVVKPTKRLVYVEATLVDEHGVPFARAHGRFVPLSVQETLAVDDRLLYRGGEERVFDALRNAQPAG
jgi:uncharacterized protein (TIGR00369 family)